MGKDRDLLVGLFRHSAERSQRAKAMEAILGEERLEGESRPRSGVLRPLEGVGFGDGLIHDLTPSETGLPKKPVLLGDVGEVEIETVELALNEGIPDHSREIKKGPLAGALSEYPLSSPSTPE